MIILGVALLILAALVPKLAVLWTIGIILIVLGVVFAVLGHLGHAVGGRQWY